MPARCAHALALLLMLAPLASLRGQARPFTLEQYANVARVTDVRVAPSGDRALLVVAWPNYESNAWESDLIQVDLRTKATTTLTHRKTATSPRWSPDGSRIAFLASVEGRNQLFVMPAGGGEARQVTRSPTALGIIAWSPDGARLAFSALNAAESRGKFDDAYEVSDNDYLTQASPRPVLLWTVAPDGGDARAVTGRDRSSLAVFPSVAWSPDGRSLVITRQDGPGSRGWERRSLASIDISTGAEAPLAGVGRTPCTGAWPSPDGSQLLLSCPMDGHVKNQNELLVMPTSGGAPRSLTRALDRNFARGIWRGDSQAIVTVAADGMGSGVWEIPLQGAPRRLNVGALIVTDYDVARDGAIVFIASEAKRPPELYVLRAGAPGPERLTDLHAAVAALDLGAVETITWSSDDGLPLDGTVTFPPGFDATKRYPLLLVIHGGPWGSSRPAFRPQSQAFASKGFLIFEPNYRGSDHRGNALFAAVYRDHGAGPGRDVMRGLALLRQRAYVDTSRIGVSGWSYGGYMTTWLIGHYQGWKAAMAGAAVIDLVDDYNLNDLSLHLRAYGETLTFPKDLALMRAQSPMSYADAMRTPLLLLSTTGDVRVPVTQSYKLYNALRERGRDVRMRLWPVPGHFPADPWRARDVDRSWLEWFVERLRE